MPIFEFRCPQCHAEFESLVRRSETPSCPDCESREVTRLMSSTAARLGSKLPVPNAACPPIEAGPCGPGCCRLPD